MSKTTYVSGKSLTTRPVFNGKAFNEKTGPLTKAIVANIKSRRAFTNGVEFINSVAASVAKKFPGKTENNIQVAVRKALATYFTQA
jgi:hypothetical protein